MSYLSFSNNLYKISHCCFDLCPGNHPSGWYQPNTKECNRYHPTADTNAKINSVKFLFFIFLKQKIILKNQIFIDKYFSKLNELIHFQFFIMCLTQLELSDFHHWILKRRPGGAKDEIYLLSSRIQIIDKKYF